MWFKGLVFRLVVVALTIPLLVLLIFLLVLGKVF